MKICEMNIHDIPSLLSKEKVCSSHWRKFPILKMGDQDKHDYSLSGTNAQKKKKTAMRSTTS